MSGWLLHKLRKVEQQEASKERDCAVRLLLAHEFTENDSRKLGLPVDKVAAVSRGGLMFSSPLWFAYVTSLEMVLMNLISLDFFIHEGQNVENGGVWVAGLAKIRKDEDVNKAWKACVVKTWNEEDDPAWNLYFATPAWGVLFQHTSEVYLRMRLKDGAASILSSLLVRLGNTIRTDLSTICKLAKERAQREKKAGGMSAFDHSPSLEHAGTRTGLYTSLVADVPAMDVSELQEVAANFGVNLATGTADDGWQKWRPEDSDMMKELMDVEGTVPCAPLLKQGLGPPCEGEEWGDLDGFDWGGVDTAGKRLEGEEIMVDHEGDDDREESEESDDEEEEEQDDED